MRKPIVFLLFAFIIFQCTTIVNAQMYVLNEDFSTATGSTPPAGWTNYSSNGTSDLWSFDNPGGRTINFPVLPPFAIFDSEFTSANGSPEEVVLESQAFDASISNYIILKLDHTFSGGPGSSGKIEAFNGSNWSVITNIASSTSNPSSDIIDISPVVGGITNAKIRFTWSGNGSGFWAIDNISIFVPLAIDAGLPELNNPTMPFNAGVQDIKVTLANFGYQTLNTTRIKWSIDGIQQPDYVWNGNLTIGTQQENITIGSWNFIPEPVNLKIWQEQPNGQQDLNPDNDSIVRRIQPALCGDYTIGGSNADFGTFTEAINVLKTSGISCPVVFNIRNGVYNEEFILSDVTGSSEVNTITFQSESADSSAVSLISSASYNVVSLRNISNVKFKQIGFSSVSGYTTIYITPHCENIAIENCLFNQGGTAIQAAGSYSDSLRNISIINNTVSSNMGYSFQLTYASSSKIEGNNIYTYGISAYNNYGLIVRNNRIITDKSYSLNLNDLRSCNIYNNYIKTIGSQLVQSVYVSNSINTKISFNTIDIHNTDLGQESRALQIDGSSSNLVIRNNIFNVSSAGYPIWIGEGANGFNLDYNNYFSPTGLIGKYNNVNYYELSAWQAAINNDNHSFDVNSFLNGISMNQALLNNSAIPIVGISNDIDNNPRNPTEPDFGAQEYNPCNPDAGINSITSPGNSISGGTHEVKVILQNQGNGILTQATINWTINNTLQTPFNWNGNLGIKQNIEVSIGSYNFNSGMYSIKAWTSAPNGSVECNNYNDTSGKVLATPLCGPYTIGGSNPDFASFTEAVNVLKTSGISCPVVFNIRNGVYYEEFILSDVTGSSEVNTITFQSESSDSSAVSLISSASYNVVSLRNISNVKFKQIGFSSVSGYTTIYITPHCENIAIENCLFNQGGTAIQAAGSYSDSLRNISIINNTVSSNMGYSFQLTYASSSKIEGNNIYTYGISAYNNYGLIVRNNRIITDKSYSLNLNDLRSCNIYNNYIKTIGSQLVQSVYVSNSINTKISFNTIDIHNTDIGQESRAFQIEGSSSNLTIRNNIFNVSSAGYPIWIGEGANGFNLDYNNYFSSAGLIGKYNNVNYTDITTWGASVNGDANSTAITPMFKDNNDPLPYQRDFNGAAIPIGGILLDINGKIRNDQAPDIGCVEFMIDFGIIEMINPSLECFHGLADSVKVFLRQFGDLPFQDLNIAYRVNNGTVYAETIGGSISNDLVYTFKTPVDISPEGEYIFKVWLINTRDDNSNNDTLTVTRYTKPAPAVSFEFDNECTGREVHFTGTASVTAPYFVASYEWIFNNGDTSLVQNPVYEFPAPGSYPVILRAYSDAGCYNYREQIVTVGNYEKIDPEFTLTPESCSGVCNGQIQIAASGGESPLQYFLNDAQAQTDISGLCPGNYTIVIRDNKGCEVSDNLDIQEGAVLQTGISYDAIEGFIPFDVALSATVNAGSSYEWYYQGSKFDTAASTSLTITDQGAQEIVLMTTGPAPGSCVKYDTLQVKAVIYVDIFIPNTFTPNGDGYNDTFGPRTEGIRSLEMNITDRNGRNVYSIDKVNGKWDGSTEAGDPALQGIYFYVLKAIGYDNLDYHREGSVTLYRDLIDMTPNPVKSIGLVDLSGHMSVDKELTIFNSSGIVIREWHTPDDLIELDLSSLRPGVYFMKAKDAHQSIVIKFVKE